MYTDDTLKVPSEEEREEVPDLPQTSETGQLHAVAVAKHSAFHLGGIDPPGLLQLKGNLAQNWREW